jgi:tetratricopeptide (TPR) repeat protein
MVIGKVSARRRSSMKDTSIDRTDDAVPGLPFGSKYRLLRPLGGADAEQYVVEDLAGGGRRRIIRVVRDTPEVRVAAESACRVVHDRILGVNRIEPAEDGRLLLILDAVEGEILADRIDRLGPMREDRIREHMSSIAGAMDQAHAVGVAHGALTCASVLLDEDDDALLLGMAVDAAVQSTSDAPAPDASEDVHAFAALIYTALNGAPPSLRGDLDDVAKGGSDLSDENESITHRALRRAALKGLDRDPERRPRTCGELMAEVDAEIRAASSADGAHAGDDGEGQVHADYATPLDLLDLESAIAELVPRKPRLQLPDHTGVRTAWEKGDRFLASGAVYKQLQHWQAAGEALERARTEFDAALRMDTGLVASRMRHQQLSSRAGAMQWAEHPQSFEQRDRVGAMLDPERGAWWSAWDEGRLADADRVLEEVEAILQEARFDNRSIASANALRTRWRALQARMPERVLDHRFDEELRDHRAVGQRAEEAFEGGRFDTAGGLWSTRVDRFSAVLDDEAAAHQAAMDARGRFDEAIRRTPKSRPMSSALRNGLAGLSTESDRIENELFGRGRFNEAAAAWAASAASIGGLVQDDVERFGRMETARESYAKVESMRPQRRAVWTRLSQEGAAVHTLVGQATAARDAGEFDTAAEAWQQATRRFKKAMALDGDRHREGILAVERFDRKIQSLPPRMLDRSVRADIERLLKRRPLLDEWMKTGRFTEVEEAVGRAIESIDKALQIDSGLHDAAVAARDEAASFIVEMPAEVPELVHVRMRPAATEIDATAVQARQAFELGEYADCAEAWRRNIEQRREFAEDMRREIDRYLHQQQRTAMIRTAGAVVTVGLVLFVVLEVAGRVWMGAVSDRARAALPTPTPQALLDRQESLITRADTVVAGPSVLIKALGEFGLGGQVDDLRRRAETLAAVGAAMGACEARLPVADEAHPKTIEAAIEESRLLLDELRTDWDVLGEGGDAADELQTRIERLTDLLATLQADIEIARVLDERIQRLRDRVPEAGSSFVDVRQAWSKYAEDLGEASADWEDGKLKSVELLTDRLGPRADELDSLELQRRAEAARDEFRKYWNAPDFVAIRVGRGSDIEVRIAEARGVFEDQERGPERLLEAEERWRTLLRDAKDLRAELSQGHDDFQRNLAEWNGLRDADWPTDWILTNEKRSPIFKTKFDQAIARCEGALEYKRSGDSRATKELSGAVDLWRRTLKELDGTVKVQWDSARDPGGELDVRMGAANWLSMALADVDGGSEARKLANELQWLAETPVNGDTRTWTTPHGDGIDMVFVRTSGSFRIGDRTLKVSGFWISVEPVDPQVLDPSLRGIDGVEADEAIRLASSVGNVSLLDELGNKETWFVRVPTNTEWERAFRGQPQRVTGRGEWVWDRPAPAEDRDRNLSWWAYLHHKDPGGPQARSGRVYRDRLGNRQEDPDANENRRFRIVFSPVKTPNFPEKEAVKQQENPRLAGRTQDFVNQPENRRTISLGDNGPSIDFVRVPAPNGGELWVATTETTQEVWERVVGDLPPMEDLGDDLPVANMTNMAIEGRNGFLRKLSSKFNVNCRLPTTEEWRYFAGAGESSGYCFGDEQPASYLGNFANFKVGANGKLEPVGKRRPNFWGLYDVHGNVRERCSGVNGSTDVLGGSHLSDAEECRIDRSTPIFESQLAPDIGFRLVLK